MLILTNRLIIGGISNDIIPLAYYLQPYFDILILYGEKAKDEIEADFLLTKYPGLNVKKITTFKKNNNPFNDLAAYKHIKQLMKDFKPDIVHTHGVKSGFMGRRAAYKLGVPCILHTFHGHHFHSYYNKFINSILLKVERKLGGITTAIIAISSFQKKELAEIYKIIPVEKIKTISLGVDAKRITDNAINQRNMFRQKYHLAESIVAIGIAGRMVPIKNLSMFVHAAYKLKESVQKQLCFFIIGDGMLKKQIEQECIAFNLSYSENADDKADVIFTSWIEDIIPAMHAMDIVALTSENEGTPLSLIEAQWCGKPVVATNVGGVRDTLIDNETGFLVEANDTDAMISKLKMLIENDALRNTMGIKAALFAAANFSKETEVENYRQLYKNMLTPKNVQRSAYQHASIE